MQTIQLLPDAAARAGFLAARAARISRPAACVAMAIADALEGVRARARQLPLPDLGERDGWRFVSQPVGGSRRPRRRADRAHPPGRRARRRAHDGAATRSCSRTVTVEMLEAEGAPPASSPSRRARCRTDDHVGSDVVVLRA